MALGIGAGSMGGMASAAGSAAAGGSQGGPKGPQSGPKGSTGNSGGKYTPNGVPIDEKKPATTKPLSSIPDVDHAPPVGPIDLSLQAGPLDLPQRRPLTNAAVSVPQTGVTGYAGVFIP